MSDSNGLLAVRPSESNGLLAVRPSESNGLLAVRPCLTVMGYLQLGHV